MAFSCQNACIGTSGVADEAWNETVPPSVKRSSSLDNTSIPRQQRNRCVFRAAGVMGSSMLDLQPSIAGGCAIVGKTVPGSVFLDLPPVLILEIFKHLDARELSTVACVCSVFRYLASDSRGWKDFYCERWGLPASSASDGTSAILPDKAWKDLYVARELRSKAFMGRFIMDSMHGHTDSVRCVRILAQANLVFTAGCDFILRVWNLEEGIPVAWSRPLGCTLRAIAVDMEILVLAGTDGKVRVWRAVSDLPHLFDISNISGGSSEVVLSGHTGPISCLGIDAARIYSGSWDMNVRIWNRFTFECVRTLMHIDWVWALVIRGHRLVTTAGSDTYSWDIETGELLRFRRETHTGNTYAVECSRSGHFLFTGGEDGFIRMFDDRLTSKREVKSSVSNGSVATWKPHSEAVYALAFEDPWLVSASGDGSLAMIDVGKIMKRCGCKGRSDVVMKSNKWSRKCVGISHVIAKTDAEPPERMLHGFHHGFYAVDVGAERVFGAGKEKIIRVWDFSQALEIERRVQASRTVRLQRRFTRKQAAACTVVAKCGVVGRSNSAEDDRREQPKEVKA
eukprot:c28180_g1_i1 orf=318-2015(+)